MKNIKKFVFDRTEVAKIILEKKILVEHKFDEIGTLVQRLWKF